MESGAFFLAMTKAKPSPNIGSWILYATWNGERNQSGTATLLNIGINAVMLRLPPMVSIGYGIGSMTYTIQQNAFNLFIKNGYGDEPALYNVTW